MLKNNKFIKNYINTFENLSSKNLNELNLIFHDDIIFKDPFNEVKGKKSVIYIFEKMFVQLDKPKFKVIDYGISKSNNNIVYLRWFLLGKFKNSSKLLEIQGMSEVIFNNLGKVISHTDHWDSLSELLIKLPKIGFIIDLFKRKFL